MSSATANSYRIDEHIKLVYQKPEVFSKNHVIYFGQKYGNYFFRSSPATLLEKAQFLDSGYSIIKDNVVIGGVFLKPNFMSDLFVVPPYSDYEYIAKKLLNLLKEISNSNEKIVVSEVLEAHVPFYSRNGCNVFEEGFWMIRPTQSMRTMLSDNFAAKPVHEEDKDEIAHVILSAYKGNPAYKEVDSNENYVNHVVEFIKNNKDNEVMYNSSKIVVDKTVNEIVGTCLHMEFEGFPLIMSLAVRPDYQGKGIGKFLLSHSINHSKKAYSATRLYVLKGNEAIKLYEHMGFIKNATLNDMYLLND
ncbi:GNAT family N-acetyltransferase [Virgibacillus flavescens]|uniref:GNAT family N-acetyltransferase n=1 Tax=Virgibacillus flavescens TaxID=1611422 RepID=UPI003D34DE6C